MLHISTEINRLNRAPVLCTPIRENHRVHKLRSVKVLERQSRMHVLVHNEILRRLLGNMLHAATTWCDTMLIVHHHLIWQCYEWWIRSRLIEGTVICAEVLGVVWHAWLGHLRLREDRLGLMNFVRLGKGRWYHLVKKCQSRFWKLLFNFRKLKYIIFTIY